MYSDNFEHLKTKQKICHRKFKTRASYDVSKL